MRLSPAVGALLPREILEGGLIVDGEYFPAGVDIGVPIYSVHHHEAYYPEPFEFKPEVAFTIQLRRELNKPCTKRPQPFWHRQDRLCRGIFSVPGDGNHACGYTIFDCSQAQRVARATQAWGRIG